MILSQKEASFKELQVLKWRACTLISLWHFAGESRRAKRLGRAHRLRSGLCHLLDPGSKEPDELRRPDREGVIRGEHQIPESLEGCRPSGCQPRGRLEDEGENTILQILQIKYAYLFGRKVVNQSIHHLLRMAQVLTIRHGIGIFPSSPLCNTNACVAD